MNEYLSKPIVGWLRERQSDSLAGRKYREAADEIERLRNQQRARPRPATSIGRSEPKRTALARRKYRSGHERELILVLRRALKHMRHFRAWDYSDSMRGTIERAERLLT